MQVIYSRGKMVNLLKFPLFYAKEIVLFVIALINPLLSLFLNNSYFYPLYVAFPLPNIIHIIHIINIIIVINIIIIIITTTTIIINIIRIIIIIIDIIVIIRYHDVLF